MLFRSESVKHPCSFFHNNTAGTNSVLNAMKYWGVNKIIYSSTAGVYASRDTPIVETDEIQPMNNPYAGSKYSAELAIRHSGVDHIIFRYFNLAGADVEGEFGECHQPETHLIPLVLQVAAGRRRQISVFGTDYDTPDGTCIRDYVHVTDLCAAHLKALERLFEGAGGGEIGRAHV